MRNIIVFLVVGACVFTGCTQRPEVRLKDPSRMDAISRGMEKKFLLRIMGTDLMTVRDRAGDIREIVPNPYDTQVLALGGKEFELVTYFTNPDPTEGPIARDELTPFVFDDDQLIGWGWEFVDFLKQSLEDRTTSPDSSRS